MSLSTLGPLPHGESLEMESPHVRSHQTDPLPDEDTCTYTTLLPSRSPYYPTSPMRRGSLPMWDRLRDQSSTTTRFVEPGAPTPLHHPPPCLTLKEKTSSCRYTWDPSRDWPEYWTLLTLQETIVSNVYRRHQHPRRPPEVEWERGVPLQVRPRLV